MVAVLLLAPPPAGATPILVYVEDTNLYQNTENNPCLFNGTQDGAAAANLCSQDPADWQYPVGPTGSGGSGTLFTLEQTFSFATWDSFVGQTFVLGFDVNQSSTEQTLFYFNIYFDDTLAYSFSSLGGTAVPAPNNGNGWADYVLSAGCTTPQDVSTSSFDNCPVTSLMPFVVSDSTSEIRFTLQYFGNDGPDKIFALTEACPEGGDCFGIPFVPPPVAAVPEPGSLALLGTGLVAASRFWKRTGRRA